jgi:hypothetical protein
LAESTTLRSPHLRDILNKARPKHEPETQDAEESLRESRPAMPTPMLDFVFRNGKVRSFNYAYLAEVEFEPGDTLILKFSNGATVFVEGRGLARHRVQVRLHRAESINECSESELALEMDGISQVERIHITEGDEK